MKKLILAAALFCCIVSVSTYGQTRNLNFTNNSGMTVTGVYLQPTGVTGATWGSNIWTNTDSRFMNGSNYPYTQTYDNAYTGCTYDVRYTGDDGKDYYMTNVDLCGSTPITFTNSTKMTK